MDFFIRAVRFLRLHVFKNTLYFFTYGVAYFLPSFMLNISFYKKEAVATLVNEGKSLIRLGDGEFYILNNGNISYQKFDPRIKNSYKSMIKNYRDSSPYVLCLNELALKATNTELRKRNLLRCWLPAKVWYFLYFPKKVTYLDQSLFYYGELFQSYLEKYIVDKKVIAITRRGVIDSIKNNSEFPSLDIEFIETPPAHAFDKYDEICTTLDNILEKNKLEKNKPVVVLAAFGPASKVLAYEYATNGSGVVVIDIGVGLEIIYTGRSLAHSIFPEYAYD